MQRSPHRIGRLVSFGLATVLVIWTVFALSVALTTHRLGQNVRTTSSFADAYDQSRYAIASEESLERKYRLEPSAEVRAKHRAAADALVTTLAQVYRHGTAADQQLVDGVLADHGRYLDAIHRMFGAVDALDPVLANAIDEHEIDPVFDTIETRVSAAAIAHNETAQRHLKALGRTATLILVATPIVFAAGLLLLTVLLLVLRAYQRRYEQSAKDETDAKQQALRVSEERFRSLVLNATDIIGILEADGTIRYISPSVSQILGYTTDELLGLNAFTLVHPHDREPSRATMLDQLANPTAPYTPGVSRVQHKEGAWRYLEMLSTNLLSEPSVRGVVLNARDVTERIESQRTLKATEARYRELFENANDIIFITDLAGNFTDLNRAARQLLGYTPAEVVGLTSADVVLPEYLGMTEVMLARKLQDSTATTYDIVVRAKDGRRCDLANSAPA